MLPYCLRPPAYGKLLERLKREQGKNVPDGGRLQKAIKEDLIQFQASFVDEMQKRSNQRDPQESHWKQGAAFSLFKQGFGDSKIAMLHLLTPPRCDGEAFSQLIYEACLEIFRDFFSSSFEHACSAIFSLYALFETNPLPRELAWPEIMPIGIRAAETRSHHRSLFRRAFRQRIRIDRFHYLMFLQLREMALANKAECERKFHEQKGRCCSCSIARDVVEVLNRLAPQLDFCEYTGPVGLEALAGHPDYPYKVNAKTREPSRPEPKEASFQCTTKPFEFPEALSTLMQTYQKRIEAIRLPQSKSYATKRVQKCLEPFYDSLKTQSWIDIRSQLFGIDDEAAKAEPKRVRLLLADPRQRRLERARRMEEKVESLESEASDRQNSFTIEINDMAEDYNPASLPQCQLVLSGNIPRGMQQGVGKAVQILMQRDRLPQINSPDMKESISMDADDMSSIGVGGISVATSHGRTALQTLLSKVRGKAAVPRTIGSNTSKQEDSNLDSAMMFLGADQAIKAYRPDEIAGEEDSSSEISGVSNLSEEEDNDEIATVATSTVGRRALENLLAKVAEPKVTGRKSKSTPKRRSRRKAQAKSTAKRRSSASGSKPTTRKRSKGNVEVEHIDHGSVDSSIGQGKATLDALLDEVERRAPP